MLQGKESIVLDLDDAADRDGPRVVGARRRRRAAGLPGRRRRALGVRADDLHALNPELVYVSSPGYGSGPPCGRKPAFAPTMGAASGLAVRNIGGAACLPIGTDLDLDEVKRTAIRLAAGAMGPGNADGVRRARGRHRAAARAGRSRAPRRRQRAAHVDAVDGRARTRRHVGGRAERRAHPRARRPAARVGSAASPLRDRRRLGDVRGRAPRSPRRTRCAPRRGPRPVRRRRSDHAARRRVPHRHRTRMGGPPRARRDRGGRGVTERVGPHLRLR